MITILVILMNWYMEEWDKRMRKLPCHCNVWADNISTQPRNISFPKAYDGTLLGVFSIRGGDVTALN